MKKSRRERRRPGRRIAVFATFLALFTVATHPELATAKLLVFAAASTSGAIGEIARTYSARGLGEVDVAFASSSTLARQIAAGAPADAYISATPQWMDYLSDRKTLAPDSRRDLVGNRLVLVTPNGRPLSVPLRTDFPLIETMDGKPLAMGDPDHVPAGMYARAALESLGLWESLAAHIAPMHHVRAALTLVERGEAALGIVYATDAAASSRVSVAAMLPAGSHPPILYPAAIIAQRDRPEVRRFFAFLTSSEAMTIFAKYGFTAVPPLEE